MQAAHHLPEYGRQPGDRNIIPAIGLMALAGIVALMVGLAANDSFASYPYLYILPWIFGLAVVMIAPSVFLFYTGRFSFADPLIFATWSYFFPAFVIGGILLATGISDPFYMVLVQDADYNLPYTIVLMGLGYGGMALGYLLPPGAFLGRHIDKWLPAREHDVQAYIVPGLVLLALGFLNSILALGMGILGYQKPEEMGIFDGLVYMTTLFWMQGTFLLSFVIFRQRKWTVAYVPVIAIVAATSIIKVIFAGNRGTIIQIFAAVALAYILSGRTFRVKQGVIAGSILIVALIGGMIYGTTFRSIKGSEAQVSLETYTENISDTFDQLGSNANLSTLQFGLSSLAERVDALSSVAVVVSNYEQLAPYEESYGLDNNIWKDTTTFFIPRVVWNDKPLASEPRKYSDLYFNYGENSFTITPVGDLLRNFGVPGVFVGMLIMGIVLRMLYRGLVEDQTSIVWRVVLYFMLLTSVNYETFYAAFVPALFKVGTTAVAGLFIMYLIVKVTERPLSE